MTGGHVLLLTFPAQGHINPALEFAKRLIKMGTTVTFSTTISAQNHFSTETAPKGLKFHPYSDTLDQVGAKPNFIVAIRNNSSKAIREAIAASVDDGCPITCLVYTLLLPWTEKVAREFNIPATLLWIQPATVLDIYYYYFNGFKESIGDNSNDPSWSLNLPNLPLSLSGRDLPSFILPQRVQTDVSKIAYPLIKEQLEILDKAETNPRILVNTFDALEPDALKAVEKYNLIAVGPLIPSPILGGKDTSDTSFGSDMFKKSKEDYIEWLNSKPDSSVIYASFGTLLELPKKQMEEIARGLLECRKPFLWVVRDKKKKAVEEEEEDYRSELNCYIEELEENGMIVPWCSQLEVLSHRSLGCFVTHCGWNSTLESLAYGVPTVAFPWWTDQGTNAKLIEDSFETGVRVRENGEGIVEGCEIKRCVDMIMGEGGEVKRKNAKKWKELARKAVEDGGSSDLNLKTFVQNIGDSV